MKIVFVFHFELNYYIIVRIFFFFFVSSYCVFVWCPEIVNIRINWKIAKFRDYYYTVFVNIWRNITFNSFDSNENNSRRTLWTIFNYQAINGSKIKKLWPGQKHSDGHVRDGGMCSKERHGSVRKKIRREDRGGG